MDSDFTLLRSQNSSLNSIRILLESIDTSLRILAKRPSREEEYEKEKEAYES